MPVLQFKSNAKPSTFAYPPPLEEKKKEEKERVATAILSVTAKAKRREEIKGKKEEEAMEVEEEPPKPAEEEKKEVKKEEPNFEMLSNPARVMKQQVRYIEFCDEKKRWRPVKEGTTGGILVVKDYAPDEPVTLVQAVAAHGPRREEEEEEPGPPEPFEYNDED